MERSLKDMIGASGRLSERYIADADTRITLSDVCGGTGIAGTGESLQNHSVLVATHSQLAMALALVELDGVVRRLVLCPAGLPAEHLTQIAAAAGIDTIVSDFPAARFDLSAGLRLVSCHAKVMATNPEPTPEHSRATEWILLTSGTAGVPKMVVHTLATLIGAIATNAVNREPPVWSTFYDISRYGGLQILLRACVSGGSLVLRDNESTSDFLVRAGAHRVTHISGTPTHWRGAMMCPAASAIAPRYVRLSGEIADQPSLDLLRSFFPNATVAHAFASTEAGVAFDVDDGLAGFPVSLTQRHDTGVDMKFEDGSLRIRSARTALRYLGHRDSLVDANGFVDTGDMIEQRDDRYHFVGRRDGVINVGGLKVHPEEVEGVINSHARVQLSRVKARKNPLMGALVMAEVMIRPSAGDDSTGTEAQALKDEIIAACQQALAPHKVPAIIRFVPSLDVAASGKLVRASV